MLCGVFVCLQVIGSQIKQDDTACLAYWLSITVTLLHLLQRNIKPASGSNRNANLVAAAARLSIIESLFGRQPGAGAHHRARRGPVTELLGELHSPSACGCAPDEVSVAM
jgi:hypothetical protein